MAVFKQAGVPAAARVLRLGLLLGLFLGLGPVLMMGTAWAQTTPKVVTDVTTGRAKIFKSNLQAAKKSAESDALANALQNAVTTLLPGQAVGSGLEFIYTALLPNARDYVVTYKVLGGVTLKDQYLVGVESKISLALVEKKLTRAGLLRSAEKERPTLLLLIAEQTPGDLLPKYWWGNNPAPYASVSEEAIAKAMARDRFDIAGAGPKRPDPGTYNIRFKGIYDDAAAMDLGRALKADVVIVGKASATESINRMGDEKTFDARINLTAWDIATGGKITDALHQAAAKSGRDTEGTTRAISKAAAEAAQDLSASLTKFWARNQSKESRFDVHIQGEAFLPRFIALKKRFREIPEISDIQPREIGSDRAVMEITYNGSPLHFADMVMLKTFEGFGIDIAEVDDSRVVIRFINQQADAPATEDTARAAGTEADITEKTVE